MLTDIVKRMHGAERVERDGSVFSILVNLHASHGGGPTVDQVTRTVFSNVVDVVVGKECSQSKSDLQSKQQDSKKLPEQISQQHSQHQQQQQY